MSAHIVRTLHFARACGETESPALDRSIMLREVDEELPEKKENKESTYVTGLVGVVSRSRCCQ